jgi:beta-galactosidase
LWSPDDPYLYTVQCVVRVNGKVVDEVEQPLGFRWYSFDADNGFYLNGKQLSLRGTNRHQDYKNLGNAVPDSLHVHDMELIKGTGFNFVRLAHYPQDPSVLEAADRLGILIWEEIPIVNYITNSPQFRENSLSMLTDMIRQHRNHPSVILWGYMNEIFLRVPKGADELYPATVALAKELDKTARAEDPTRPTVMAMHQSELYNTYGLADVPSVVGWNIYQGWYSGDVTGFGKFIDDQHQRYRKRPVIISEYGANGDLRLHSLDPRRFDSTAEYQRQLHESYIDQIDKRPFIAGSALWSTFDFGSEFRGETIPHVNQKGLFTFDRRAKEVDYFYKARLSKSPLVRIATRDWPVRAGRPDTKYDVEVYSNLPAVELFVNGRAEGERSIESGRAHWSLTFRPGSNLLIARSKIDGRILSDSTTVEFQPVTVASPEIRINVGSNADFIDRSGHTWLADQSYTAAGWGAVGTGAKFVYSASDDRNVLGTDDDPLYQTMQMGLSGYKVDVPSGTYEVQLLFAEKKFMLAGQRVFNVAINGKLVITSLDLAAKPGPLRPYSAHFKVTTAGGINIEFTSLKGEPILSGLFVRDLR